MVQIHMKSPKQKIVIFSHETRLLLVYKVFTVLFEGKLQVKSTGGWLVGEFDGDGPKLVRSAVELNFQPTVLMKTTCRQGDGWRFFPSVIHFTCPSFCFCK